MPPFIDRNRVEYAQTDMAGIVHFSEFFKYMECAEHALFRSIGLSVVQEDGDRKLSWPRVSCGFDFREPLRFEDEFEIRMSVEKIGTRSVTFRAEVHHGDRIMATGHSTSVCCELQPGGGLQPVPVPDFIREKLQVYA